MNVLHAQALIIVTEDERSIANKLERESKRENETEAEKDLETKQHKKDATLPVCSYIELFYIRQSWR